MQLVIFLIIIVGLVIGLPVVTSIVQYMDNKNIKYTTKTIDIQITNPDDYEMVINLKDKQDIYNQQISDMEENIKYIQADINQKYKDIEMTQLELNDILLNMPNINSEAIKLVYEQDIIEKRKHINKLNMNISKLKNNIVDCKIKSDAITHKLEEIGLKYL